MSPPDEKQQRDLLLRAKAERHIDNERLTRESPAHPDEKLLHELQVHQVELEMQNEALRQKQTELEAARDRYVDLYDFAPVGYLTLDTEGMIEETNFTAVALLGRERKKLLRRSFASMVLDKDQARWMTLFMSVKQGGDNGTAELAVRRGDGTVFQVRLDCAPQKVMRSGALLAGDSVLRAGIPGDGASAAAIRIALTDVSLRKSAEAALLKRNEELERFNRAAVDRELAMIDLKRQVNALSRELGRTPPFALDFADAPTAKGPT